MYCRNCGRKIEDGKDLCEECEAKLNAGPVTETPKVEVVEEVNTQNANNQNYNNQNYNNQNYNAQNVNPQATVNTTNNVPTQKSKLAAGLFGIFLGTFGVHNFYLGYTGKAVAQLLISVLSCGFLAPVSSIWGLIEGILILAGSESKDGNGNPLKD